MDGQTKVHPSGETRHGTPERSAGTRTRIFPHSPRNKEFDIHGASLLDSSDMPASPPDTSPNDPAPANPFSTGGGGTSFEYHVQASFVATLLVRGIVPCLPPNQVTIVHLQAGHLGLHTDDFVCEAVDTQRRERRLIGQIKHHVRISERDEQFREAIERAWLDFRGLTEAGRELDAFALISGPISGTIARDFRTMLEWARSGLDARDFLRKMAIPKYASNTAREYLKTIRGLCDTVNGTPISDEELWQFLRRYHLLSFDFDVGGSQDLARVKTMLALAAQPSDGTSGDALWNKIFHFVSQSAPRAGSLTRDQLPTDILERCASLSSQFEHGPVQRLREHAKGVLIRIRTKIANMPSLPRDEPRHGLSDAIEEHPFVIVTGPAGASKSALTRMTFEQSFPETPLFAFQATEFARAHLDQVFSELRIGAGLSELSALFALHRQKCLLIDSVERLLETETRDAFSMFLDQVAADSTWRVVLTCRRYSLEQVREAFFRPIGIYPATFEVPLFNDEELSAVGDAVPALVPLLTDPRTRRLLRNPFLLDKASSIAWPQADPQPPLDERRLRETLWRQIIMREDVRRNGLPLKRERCFQAVALCRAKAMRPFVPFTEGDEEAMQALLNDELLIRDEESGGVAPTHDVLEDWALTREIGARFEATNGRPVELFQSLGHELAMRRSYRHWLQESFDSERGGEIFRFATAAIRPAEVEPYWRDETLVSLMLSEHADHYLRSQEATLLEDNKKLLRRIAHLLRVACKSPNPLFAQNGAPLTAEAQSLFLVPDGPGWNALLQVIERNLPSFTLNDVPWVLGLLKDWRSGIMVERPAPAAMREAGLIALRFWQLTEDAHIGQDDLRALVSVILASSEKIPTEFTALLTSLTSSKWNYRNSQFAERLLTSFDGVPACRAMPIAVAQFVRHAWGLDQPAPVYRETRGSLDRDSWYGLRDEFHLRLNPASAIHGPFLFLLHGDPQTGQRLIVDLTNIAMERAAIFARQENEGREPASVEVFLKEGRTVRQWASDQFWRIYREPSFAPDVVTCALMALEKWLLDLAADGHDLQEACYALLEASNNVAISAVVASVAVAYPERVGDVVLALFRVPQFFRWDQVRSSAGQFQMHSLLAGIPMPAEHRIYDEERKQSAKLPHRSRDLEWLMSALQFTEMRDPVQKIIDSHRAALPPEQEQSRSMREWRLLLHRADLRRRTMDREPGTGFLVFTSTAPEPDLQRMVEEHAPIAAAHNEQLHLMNWAVACFNRKTDQQDPSLWPEMMALAKRLLSNLPENGDEHERMMVRGGSAYVAAVCVRDRWEEMQAEERAWCRSLLLNAVFEEQDSEDSFVRASRFPMHGSRPAARTLPLLLRANIEENASVRLAIASALTHASDEVREFAAWGIREYLWAREADTAWVCAAGLVRWSEIEREAYQQEQGQPWNERKDATEIARARLPELRASIANRSALPPDDVLRLDLSDWCGRSVLWPLLLIIGGEPQSALAQRFHLHVAMALVRSWSDDRQRRNYEVEAIGAEHLALFVLRIPLAAAEEIFQPIIATVTDHPAEVAEWFEQLVLAEDRLRRGGNFWVVWQRLADALLAFERWEASLMYNRRGVPQLAEVLFLQGIQWKPDARDWAPLHGNEQRLEALFSVTGHCPPAFAAFCGLLNSIGSKLLLPQAIALVSERLTSGAPRQLLAGRDVLWNLELVLSGCIYGTPSTIRSSPRLLAATIHVLDEMVEQGSSAAFRLREFIITPLSS